MFKIRHYLLYVKTKMGKKLKWIFLGLTVAFAALVVIPLIAGAITQSDALAGLQEYFKFLISLAEKGLEGYKEYLKALA